MKKIIFFEILKNLHSKPKLFKKLKTLVVFGVIGILLAGTVTFYFGVVGARYVASIGKEMNIKEQVEILNSKVEQIPTLVKTDCLTTAQGLLSVEGLLNKPLLETLQNLRQACWAPGNTDPATSKESDLI